MDIAGISFTGGDRITFDVNHTDYPDDQKGIIDAVNVGIRTARLVTDVAQFHVGTELTTEVPQTGYFIVRHSDGSRAWHPTWIHNVTKPGIGTVRYDIHYADSTDLTNLKTLLVANGYAYEPVNN